MIPKIIHQIWIGPKKIPKEWMETWHDKNKSMEYILWDEKTIDDFGLRFQDRVDYLIGEKKFSIASDIIRIEILDRFGGVYVDVDSICVESIENESFMMKDFFAGEDYDHKKGKKGQINLVANGTIGSVKRSIILKDYLKKISETRKEGWWEYGARMLTDCIKGKEGKEVIVLPTYAFYPKNWDGRKAKVEGKNYAYHKWGSTKNLY